MDPPENISVLVQNSKMVIPAKFADVSEYMRGLLALGFEDDDEIVVDSVSKHTFEDILAFYKLCNYEDIFIKTPIKTNRVLDLLETKYCEFIEKYPIESKEFKSLIQACEFLGCKTLMRVCACRCACYLYFDDSREALEKKQEELKVKINVEFEDNERFKKLYPFLNN